LSRAVIELGGDSVEVGLRMDPEVASLGEVLAQQAVGVLVRTALPRAAVEYLEIADRSLAGHR
jgi:hypothetical protein